MLNLQWGGYTNGRIPTSALVDVTGRGDYLEPAGAAQWHNLTAACLRETGVFLTAAAGSSANRPYDTQVEFFTDRYVRTGSRTGLCWDGSYWTKKPGVAVAAVPGTSNHGWARAIDLTGYEGRPDVWAWLLLHAHEYGFDWTTGRASGESWHWESLTPPGTTVAELAARPLPTPEPSHEGDAMSIAIISNSEVPGQFAVYSDKNGWTDLEYGAAGAAQLRGIQKIADTMRQDGKAQPWASLSGEEYIATRGSILGDEAVRLASPTAEQVAAFTVAITALTK